MTHTHSPPPGHLRFLGAGTTNPKGFCLATQDEELKEVLRRVPGIPLFHINYNLITLEVGVPVIVIVIVCRRFDCVSSI